MFHLGGPLSMGGPAESETMGEKTMPVFPIPIGFLKSLVEVVAFPFFAVGVVGVAPEPGRKGLVFIRVGFTPGHFFIDRCLGSGEAFEGGDRQLTRRELEKIVQRMRNLSVRIAGLYDIRHQ